MSKTKKYSELGENIVELIVDKNVNLFSFLIDGFNEYNTKFFPFGTNKYCEFGENYLWKLLMN